MLVTVIQNRLRRAPPAFAGMTLTCTIIANVNTLGFAVAEQPSLTGTMNLSAPTTANVATFGAHTIANIDILTLDATTIANANVFNTHAIEIGAGLATPTIVNVNAFGTHTIASIDIFTANPNTVANTNAFGTHTLSFVLQLTAAAIANLQSYPSGALIEFVGVGGGVATSYSNNGGTGDRFYITVVGNAGPSGGTYDNFLDGATGNNTTDSWFWSTAGTAWWEFDFRFLDPGGVVIDEFRWIQDIVNNHGGATFNWEGSDDHVNWTTIGAAFTLGGTTTTTVARTQVDFFKWYRIIKASGSFSSGPWIKEIEFKISEHHPPITMLVGQVALEIPNTPATVSMLVTQSALAVVNAPAVSLAITEATLEILRAWPPPEPPTTPEGDPPPSSLQEAWNTTTDYNSSLLLDYLRAGQVKPSTASGGAHKCARGISQVYGKRYWEIHLGAAQTLSSTGLGQKIAGVTLSEALGSDTESIAYRTDGKVRKGGADLTTYTAYGANADTVMIAFDETSRKVWFGLNGTWNGNPGAGTGEAAIMPAGWYYPMDHVIDQPHLKLAIFDGLPKYVGPTFAVQPTASPPSGFSWFDPVT